MRRDDWSTKKVRINPESGPSHESTSEAYTYDRPANRAHPCVVSETNVINEKNQQWRRTNSPLGPLNVDAHKKMSTRALCLVGSTASLFRTKYDLNIDVGLKTKMLRLQVCHDTERFQVYFRRPWLTSEYFGIRIVRRSVFGSEYLAFCAVQWEQSRGSLQRANESKRETERKSCWINANDFILF